MAKFIQLYGLLDPKRVLGGGKEAAFVKGSAGAGEIGDTEKGRL